MKFCSKCGCELQDEAVVCVHCGCAVASAPAAVQEPDAPCTWAAVLGFFWPLVGLILYLVWKDKTPLKAKSAGKGALIGVIVSVASTILFYVLYFVFLIVYMGAY
jgi:hypothetical protein